MKLFIEAFISAVIAVFLLNFFGLSMYTLTSLASFFVILLVLVAIEEKSGISSRRVIKQMRLERPILSTVISFMMLMLLALVFTVIHDRISILVSPIVNASVEIGLVGLAVVLAVAYRIFYHVMFKGIELDTGIDLGIKKRFKEHEKRTIIQERVHKKRENQRHVEGAKEIDVQRTVEE